MVATRTGFSSDRLRTTAGRVRRPGGRRTRDAAKKRSRLIVVSLELER
jgi:hypothetical protein